MAKKKRKKKKQHRFFWFVIKLQIVLMLLVLGAAGVYFFGGYADEVQQIRREAIKEVAASDESLFIPSQTCSVYDTNGNLISERKGDKDAQYVKYEDIPKSFVTAIISIEDKKFYRHNGVDFKAIMRAVKARLQAGKVTQGGSTITMQLAKLMYMEPSKTWQYKVEQIFLAMELEKRYSKEKILEFYLNNIYFANGYYGIDAACRGYFNCDLGDLDISQVAFLCAIPNSPSYYDPVTNMDHTITRRNLILQNMWDDGKITQEQYYEACKEEITLNRPKKTKNSIVNNFVDTYTYYCATRALMEQEGFTFQNYFDSEEEKKTYNEEYDELYTSCQKKLYSGGYKIYTSMIWTSRMYCSRLWMMNLLLIPIWMMTEPMICRVPECRSTTAQDMSLRSSVAAIRTLHRIRSIVLTRVTVSREVPSSHCLCTHHVSSVDTIRIPLWMIISLKAVRPMRPKPMRVK